jgi:hypothetical protein
MGYLSRYEWEYMLATVDVYRASRRRELEGYRERERRTGIGAGAGLRCRATYLVRHCDGSGRGEYVVVECVGRCGRAVGGSGESVMLRMEGGSRERGVFWLRLPGRSLFGE